MSTRCHLIVKDNKNDERYVYHHCDGYLEGVGKEIKEFTNSVYTPIEFTSDEFCKQIENWDDSYEYEDSGIHGDEEYIYTIDINFDLKTIKFSVEEEHVIRKYNKDKTEIIGWDSEWIPIDEYTEIINK